MAATRQKEMKASMALVATSTRCPCCPGEVWVIAIDSPRENAADGLLSASTRLAGGLGLKGVLPFRLGRSTDTPRRISPVRASANTPLLRTPGPPFPRSRGIRRQCNFTGETLTPASNWFDSRSRVLGGVPAQILGQVRARDPIMPGELILIEKTPGVTQAKRYGR